MITTLEVELGSTEGPASEVVLYSIATPRLFRLFETDIPTGSPLLATYDFPTETFSSLLIMDAAGWGSFQIISLIAPFYCLGGAVRRE